MFRILQFRLGYCSFLQDVAVFFGILQLCLGFCSILWDIAVSFRILQYSLVRGVCLRVQSYGGSGVGGGR